MAGVDQQQLQPALLQHIPAGLPVLPRRLHHHLGDALGLQPVGQRLQARGERRVGADLLAASPPTPTGAGRVGDTDAGHHLVLADIQRRGPFSDQLHRLPPPTGSPVLVAPGRANRGNDAETRARSNSSWCREGPASISDTGSHAPVRAELGRASPFSSVVAANGHGISDETDNTQERRSLGESRIGSTEQVMPEIRTHLEMALAATQGRVGQPTKPGSRMFRP
jgi:hypothetical protein